MNAHISRDIGRAMSTQLERVNHTPERLLERIAQLEDQLDLLRGMLRVKESENTDLRAVLESRGSDRPAAPQLFNGRPVITPNEAAARTWTSRSTVNRYLTSGYWQGIQVPGSNRWWVYADQPLVKKHGRKKQ